MIIFNWTYVFKLTFKKMPRICKTHLAAIFFLSALSYSHGACTYSAINTDLNTCISAATTSSTVRWFFPHGTIAEQAELCQSSAQTTLASCINNIFSACKLEAKSLKMFSTTGDNLVNAYSNLCSATLISVRNYASTTNGAIKLPETQCKKEMKDLFKLSNREAQACMSVVSATSTFTTAETAFKSAVDALPDAATFTEICGLVTTMEYTAYTTLLSATCTDSTHLAVWSSFYSTILDTYACTCSATNNQFSHVAILITVLVTSYLCRLN